MVGINRKTIWNGGDSNPENNNIGAVYTSQTLIHFDWYNPHLYQCTTVFTKLLPKIVFEASEVFVMLLVKFTSNN